MDFFLENLTTILTVVVIVSGGFFWLKLQNKYEFLENINVTDKHKAFFNVMIERGVELGINYVFQTMKKDEKSDSKLKRALEFVGKFMESYNIKVDKDILIGMIEAKLYESKHTTNE